MSASMLPGDRNSTPAATGSSLRPPSGRSIGAGHQLRASADMGAFLPERWLAPKLLEAVQGLRPLADEAGLSMAQFALAWVLREPGVSAAIIGASRPEQVDDDCGASGRAVPPELFARAEALLAGAA